MSFPLKHSAYETDNEKAHCILQDLADSCCHLSVFVVKNCSHCCLFETFVIDKKDVKNVTSRSESYFNTVDFKLNSLEICHYSSCSSVCLKYHSSY